MRKKQASIPDPPIAEAMAALKAVFFGLELGMSYVEMEGDSQLVVKAI